MLTLKECIDQKKCRKGSARGTTKRGAFWLACAPIKIRDYGGDGIGNSAADCKHFLQLRHYRDGSMSAVIHGDYWHQNGASPDDYRSVPQILECTTVEQVIVILKGETMPGECSVYSDKFEETLTEALEAIGLVECEHAPDEVIADEVIAE